MSSDTRVHQRPLAGGRVVIVSMLLILARAILTFSPTMWLWSLNSQRFLPAWIAWASWGLWAAALHPTVGSRFSAALDVMGRRWLTSRSSRWLAALALGVTVLWLEDRTWFIGDFIMRRGDGTSQALAGRYPQALPLEALLFGEAARWVGAVFHGAMDLQRLAGALSVFAIALAAISFATAVGRTGTSVAVGAWLVTWSGYLLTATGLGKPAALLSALVAIAAANLAREKPNWTSAACVGVVVALAILLHRGGLLLVPCWLLLCFQLLRGERGASPPSAAQIVGAVVPAVALGAMAPQLWRILVEFDIPRHLTGNTPTGATAGLSLRGEGLRALDSLNLVVLLVPALPLLAGIDFRGWTSRARDMRLARLASLALPWTLALLLIRPQQGLFRDIDVFAPAGVALAAGIAYLLIRFLESTKIDARVPACIALAVVVPTLQNVLIQHDSGHGLARVTAYASEAPRRGASELGRTWDFLAMRTFALRDWPGAAAATARSVSYGPSPRLLIMQGISNVYIADYGSGLTAFEQAVKRDSSLVEAWCGLAGAATYHGDIALADSANARVAALCEHPPNRSRVRQLLARYPKLSPGFEASRSLR